jgi:hypothetical protein
MNTPMKRRWLARRIFKGFAGLAMLGVLGVAALLVSLWLEHRTEVTLPTPTGAFAVGHALYVWPTRRHWTRWRPGQASSVNFLSGSDTRRRPGHPLLSTITCPPHCGQLLNAKLECCSLSS